MRYSRHFIVISNVIKVHLANKRPDIILHSRGTHDRNFLVIEAKRDGTSGDMGADLEKIYDNSFRDPLHYQYGAAVNLRSDKSFEVEVCNNPKFDNAATARLKG